jgi:hypothetical protein
MSKYDVVCAAVEKHYGVLFSKKPRVLPAGDDYTWGYTLDFTDKGPIVVRGVFTEEVVEVALSELYKRCLKLQPEVCIVAAT